MHKIFALSTVLFALGTWILTANSQEALSQARVTAASEGESAAVEEINRWTVGVASGTLAGTFYRFAGELASALNERGQLRILPVLTNGATDNIADLLYLKGIDVAIAHADVFEEYKKRRNVSDIAKRINYISQMYVSEVHLYVRPEIKTIQDLEGKTVGLHVKGAGQTTTGPIVFERLGVKPKFVFLNNKIGIKKLYSGEFAAILHNGGKPNPFIANLEAKQGYHLLPIPYDEKFSDYYVPSTFTHEDYPNLIPEGGSVDTLGIPVVLAIYNWPKGHVRYRKVARFIEYYFKHFDRLRKPPFHPKWKAINLAATVPGWTRYPLAQQMVDSLSAEAKIDTDTRSSAVELARSLGIEADEQQLFQEFLKWKRKSER